LNCQNNYYTFVKGVAARKNIQALTGGGAATAELGKGFLF